MFLGSHICSKVDLTSCPKRPPSTWVNRDFWRICSNRLLFLVKIHTGTDPNSGQWYDLLESVGVLFDLSPIRQ